MAVGSVTASICCSTALLSLVTAALSWPDRAGGTSQPLPPDGVVTSTRDADQSVHGAASSSRLHTTGDRLYTADAWASEPGRGCGTGLHSQASAATVTAWLVEASIAELRGTALVPVGRGAVGSGLLGWVRQSGIQLDAQGQVVMDLGDTMTHREAVNGVTTFDGVNEGGGEEQKEGAGGEKPTSGGGMDVKDEFFLGHPAVDPEWCRQGSGISADSKGIHLVGKLPPQCIAAVHVAVSCLEASSAALIGNASVQCQPGGALEEGEGGDDAVPGRLQGRGGEGRHRARQPGVAQVNDPPCASSLPVLKLGSVSVGFGTLPENAEEAEGRRGASADVRRDVVHSQAPHRSAFGRDAEDREGGNSAAAGRVTVGQRPCAEGHGDALVDAVMWHFVTREKVLADGAWQGVGAVLAVSRVMVDVRERREGEGVSEVDEGRRRGPLDSSLGKQQPQQASVRVSALLVLWLVHLQCRSCTLVGEQLCRLRMRG